MSRALIQYREEAPPGDLAGWVEAFWFIQTLASEEDRARHWVLPDAGLNIVLWAPGGWQQPASLAPPILSGPTVREYRRPALPGEAYLGIRFLAGAGPAFVGQPGGKLTSIIQPLHQVQPVWAERLAGRLGAVQAEADALAIVVDELRQRAAGKLSADRVMIEAADWHCRQKEPVTLKQWSTEFGLSERQFRRRFLNAVGLSPRAFVRVTRLQGVARRHLLQPEVNWGQLSYQEGFADQAHLVNEFRSLSGDKPTRFHRHLKDIDHAGLLNQSQKDGRNFQYTPEDAG